ncbi:MAG: hypothetical protein K0Q81_779 [Paenibacillus sp.]|nr:hypothetical protein [Paenibacillus sp.]
MRVSNTPVSVYFAAGISVHRRNDMFRAAMQHVEQRYMKDNQRSVRTHCFYPYGFVDEVPAADYGKFVAKQAFTVGLDIYRKPANTVGGQSLYQDIQQDYDHTNGGDIVLIGHSGGGIASYKAAQLLNENGYPVMRVFMVGSPNIPICASCKDKVFAIEHGGRWGDWISRCAFHWFHPAKVRVRLPLRGGHPYYFCTKSKDENNVSNMEKVMEFICGWLQGEKEFVYNGVNVNNLN